MLLLSALVMIPALPAAAGDGQAGLSLPFGYGQSWSGNGPHQFGGTGARNSVDLAGGDGHVRAAAGGTVRFIPCGGGHMLMIDHPNGWHTSYYHVVNERVVNGQVVGPNDWIADIGNTTPCGGSSSAAHVHFSLWHYTGAFSWASQGTYAYPLDNVNLGGWTLHQGSGNYLGSWVRISDGYTYNVPVSGFMSCGCITSHPPVNPLADGQFVSYQGHVYRIAGGAPVYVSSWDHVGGDPGNTRALSDAEWNGLRRYPADGTLISGWAPGSPDHGSVYRIAGGAPLYVSSWDHIGGDPGTTVGVDLAAVHNAGGVGVWSHLLYRPADGTLISGWAPGSPDHGSVYRIAGGAPLYVSSWDHIGGDPGTTVGVDLAAVHNAGGSSVWGHLRQFPADGTLIAGYTPGDPLHGSVYKVAGGAPIYVSDWKNIGGNPGTTVGVDLAAITGASGTAPWNHLRHRPADGTILNADNRTYKTVGGAPILQGANVAGVRVDPVAIANAGKPGVWSHLAAPPEPSTPPPAAPSPPASPGGGSTVAAPTAVTGVRVRFPARRVAVLRWPATANATSYSVRMSRKNSSKKWGSWYKYTSPSVRLTNLKKGATYRLQIAPQGPGGWGATTTWRFKQSR